MTDYEIQERIKASRERKLANPDHPSRMPVPTDVGVTDEMGSFVNDLLDNGKDGLAIRYLRAEPSVALVKDNNGKKVPTIAKGQPIGCLVAFKTDDKVLVGWSKRLMKKDEETEEELEKMSSNKRRCLYSACMRALGDDINAKSKRFGLNRDGQIIPSAIVTEVPSFVRRVTKYFHQKPANVNIQFSDEVKGALAQAAGA